MPPTGDFTQYTIVITVDGSQLPQQLTQSGNQFKLYAQTVSGNVKVADAAVKSFGEGADQATEKLSRSLAVLRPSISYLDGYAAALRKSDEIGRSFAATAQLEEKVLRAGLEVLSAEGQSLLSVLSIRKQYEDEIKSITAARKAEATAAREAQQEISRAIDREISDYNTLTIAKERAQAKIDSAVGASFTRVDDLQARLIALREGSAAEDQLRANIEARVQAQKLSISTDSEEANAIRANALEEQRLKVAIEQETAARKAQIVAANQVSLRQVATVTSLGNTARTNDDIRANIAAVQAGKNAEREFEASIMARTEAERLGIVVESEDTIALKALYVEQLKLNEQLSVARAESEGGAISLGRFGRAIGTIAAFAVIYGTINALREAIDLTVKFETGILHLETLVGVGHEQTRQWSRDLLDISVQTGVAADKLAQGMFVVTSNNYRGAEALDILTQSARASAIGLGEVDDVARVTVGAVTAFANQNLKASDTIDILIGATRSGNIQIDALATSLSRVIPIASAMGVKFSDVAAFIATFSKEGAKSDEAATALRAFLTAAEKEAPKTEKALEAVGLSWRKLRDEIKDQGLAVAFADLVQHFQHSGTDLAKVLPNVRALTGVLAVAVNQGPAFTQVSKDIAAGVGNISAASWDLTKQSPELIFKQLTAAVQVTEIQIVQGLLPTLVKISDEFKTLITGNPSASLQEFGEKVGEKFNKLANILIFLIDNFDKLSIGVEVLLTKKIADWLITASRGVDILTARVVFGEGAILSLKTSTGGLLALDFEATMAKWLLSFNFWLLAVTAGLLLLNNAITKYKESLDEAEHRATKLNDIGVNLNLLRTQEAGGTVKKSTVDAVASDVDRLTGEIDNLNKAYDEQKKKEISILALSGQKAVNEKTFITDSMKDIAEDIKHRQGQLDMANKLLSVSKQLAIVNDGAVKPTPPAPLDDSGDSSPAGSDKIQKRIDKEREEYEFELKLVKARRDDAQAIAQINEGLLKKGIDEKYAASLGVIITGTNGIAEAVSKATAARKTYETVVASGAKAGSDEALLIEQISSKRQSAIRSEADQEKVELAVLQLRKESLGILTAINQQKSTEDLKSTHSLLVENQGDIQKVSSALLAWKVALENLKPGTIAYNEALDAYNKLVSTSNELSKSHIELLQRENQEAIDKATKSVDAYVLKLALQRDRTLASTSALQAMDRELLIQDTIAKELSGKKGLDPEAITALSDKIRAGLYGVFAAEDLKKNILDPIDHLASSIREKLIGAFVDVASGVNVKWSDMLKSMYQSFLKTVFEIAAKQFQVSVTSAASQNQGSVFGTIGTLVQNFFGPANKSNQPYGPTKDGGNISVPATGAFGSGAVGTAAVGFGAGAAIGGAIGGSQGYSLAGGLIGAGIALMTTGVGFVAGAVVAIVGALVGIITAVLSNQQEWAKVDIGIKNGKFAEVQIRGDKARAAQLGGIATGIINGLNDFITGLGGVISDTSQILETIGRKGHGKDTNYFVQYAQGMVANFGNDFQAAMEFATIQALKESDFKGLTPETEAAIKNTQAQNLSQLQGDLEFAQKVFDEGLPQLGQAIEHAVQQFQADLIRAQKLGMPDANIFTQLNNSLQSQRNQLLGIQQSPDEKYHQDIKDFNDGIDRMLDQIQIQKDAAIQNQDAAKIQMDAAKSNLDSSRISAITAGKWDSEEEARYQADLKAFNDAQKLYLDAQKTIDDLTKEALLLTNSKIDPNTEAAHTPKKGHGSGGTNQVGSDRDNLRDQLHSFDISLMSEYNQAMAQIQDTYKTESKLAHNDAALLKLVNDQREKEIGNLTKQTQAKLAPWLQDHGKDDFQKNVDGFRGMIAELDKLPRSVMPKWMLDLAKGRWLADEMKVLESQIKTLGGQNYNPTGQIDAIKAQHDQLISDIKYLGASAVETAGMIKDANAAEKAALADVSNQVVGQLFSYLKDVPKYQADIVAYQEEQVNLQFAILKAQLQALGIWDQYAGAWEDAYKEATKQAHDTGAKTDQSQQNYFDELKKAQDDYVSKIREAAKGFYDLIIAIRDENKKLDLGAYSPLTAQQKYDEAKAQLNALIPRAKSGDQTALGQVNASIEEFLKDSQGYNSSGAGYQLDYAWIKNLLSQLGNLQFQIGNTVVPYDPTGNYPGVVPGNGRLVTLPDGSNVWVPYGQSYSPQTGATSGDGSYGYNPSPGPALPPGTTIPGLPNGSSGTGGAVDSYAIVQAVHAVEQAISDLRTDFNTFRDENRRNNDDSKLSATKTNQSLQSAASSMQTLAKTYTGGR